MVAVCSPAGVKYSVSFYFQDQCLLPSEPRAVIRQNQTFDRVQKSAIKIMVVDSIAHSNVNVRASVTMTGPNVIPTVREHNCYKKASPRNAASDRPVTSWCLNWHLKNSRGFLPSGLARKVSSKGIGKNNLLLLSKDGRDQRFLYPTYFQQLVSELKEL